ncbi:MAG TPA: hypothetical protein EYP19_04350 [Desulfobacterales bacterium]|jgi:hypothetical protein|nr:hypothetical protein [Desulfobacterales bacterium]
MAEEIQFRDAARRSLLKGAVDKLTTVRGIVIPVDWDGEGNMIAAAISGSDEQEYMIEQDEKGEGLLEFIRHEVEVDGVVRKATKGRKTVAVKSYRLTMGGVW